VRGLGAGLVAVGLVYVAASQAHGDGRTILYVLAAIAALVAWGSLRESSRWTRGAGGERRVARALRPLERRGWQIDHDVAKPRGGNVDHVALGPNGLFTIETKLNRFGKRELTQARGHAVWAARQYHQYATPVLCVANSRRRPKRYAGVWCMGPRHLRRFLARHRG
jgi:hypothetical protein